MTNDKKSQLRRDVKYYLAMDFTEDKIIDRLTLLGFKKSTIKNYIKAFSK